MICPRKIWGLAGRFAASALLGCMSLSGYAGERPTKTPEIKPALIYHNYCSVCHGDRGNGQSRARGSLVPPPRDFTSASDLTRDAMVAFVTYGKPGTAMVSWKTQLTETEIAAVVDYVRQTFMVVALDPRVRRGKELYAQNCVGCHGERGTGPAHPIGGPLVPRDLSSPQARAELSRERMIATVVNGHTGTPPSKLPKQDVEAVTDYVRAALMVPEGEVSGTAAYGGRDRDAVTATRKAAAESADMGQAMPNHLVADADKGRRFYNANCATCHGAKGDGKGPRAYFIYPKPRDFTSVEARAMLNRPAIYAATSMGRLGTEMPAWSKVLSKQEIANVAEYVFGTFIRPGTKTAQR